MTFLLRYWKPLACLALLLALCGYSYRMGENHEHAKLVAHLLDDVKQDLADAKALADAQAARDEARHKLDQYKPKVVERVRANPSGCTVPKPVADGLREQVRETNKTIVSANRGPAH